MVIICLTSAKKESSGHKEVSEISNTREVVKCKLELEQTLSLLSTMFVDPDNMDNAINTSLKNIGELCDCNRSLVFKFNKDRSMMGCTHEWVNRDVEPYIDNLKDLATFTFPWLIANLRGEKMIYIKDVSSLPDLAHTEKKLFGDMGISSLIAFPIYVSGDMEGFIAMSNADGKMNWQQDAFYVLRMVSNLLGMSMGVKMALQALKVSEEKWRSLVENTPNNILIVDSNGTILDINYTAPTSTPEQMIGTSIYEYILPEYHNSTRKSLENVFRNGEVDRFELVISIHGFTSYYGCHPVPIKHDGNIDAVIIIAIDITERKMAEDELRKSEAKNRAILDVMPDFLFQIRKDGTFLNYKSPRDEDLFIPPSVFLGRKMNELIPEEIAKQTMHHMEQALQTNKIQTFQYNLPVKGNIRDFEARLISSGEDEVLAIATDITKRKQAEEALKASEEKYSTLVEKGDDGIIIVQDGIIKFANRKMVELVGRNNEDILGSSIFEYIPEKYKEMVLEKFEIQLKNRKKIPLKYEMEILSRYGLNIPVEVNASLIEHSGEPAVMAILRDVAERKHYEGELKKANEYLDQLIEASPVSIVSLDSSQNIVTANHSALEMLGYVHDEVVGTSISRLILNGETFDHLDRNDFEIDFIHRNGKRLPMNVSTSVMGDGLVLTLQDMSQLRGLFISPLKEDPVECPGQVCASLDLEPGCVYIIDDEDLEMSYSVFSDIVRSGWSGLCITRQNPQLIRDMYGLSKTPFVWLTKNQVKNQLSIAPGELFKLHPTITNFIDGAEKGLVLLDGLEYLILENDFKAVMKFIEQTNDAVMASESTLLIQIDPAVFDRKEYHLLKRWMKSLPGDKS